MSTPSPAAPSKLCRVCKQDCAGKPRVKDEHGVYTCKACHENLLAQAASLSRPFRPAVAKTVAEGAKAPASASVADRVSGWGEDDELASIRSAAAPAVAAASCPGCGTPLAHDAVVCTHCGFNRATGKKAKVKIKKEGEGFDKEKAKIALWYANPLAWLAGAAAGGFISAALWALIAGSTGYEIALFGLGVGAICGGCVLFVAKGYANWLSGLMAAAAAIGGIIGGMYWARYSIVDREIGKVIANVTIPDEAAVQLLAQDTTKEMTSRGENLSWPAGVNPDPDEVEGVWQLPPEAVAVAEKKWQETDESWHDHFKEQKKKELRDRVSSNVAGEDLFSGPDTSSGSYRSARGFASGIIYKFLGVVLAFSLGAGMGVPGRD